MANWAIVIGINQYWTPKACLKGAVRDALKIREWLVSVDGGAVPSRNLTLLLGQAPGSPSSSSIPSQPANLNTVIEAIEQLLRRSGGRGERFFFYFSGHGVTSRMDFSNESAIVLSDFSNILTTNSLTLRSITELFQGTQFRQQFFIIDACRNIPWEQEYRLGKYPKPRSPVPPTQPQFIMYATSPGTKALEIQQFGDERGAFTEALLAGLQGQGTAKIWNSETEEYLVQWDNVFRYVEAEITRKKLNVGDNLIQVPRQAGERGSQNPELGRFSELDFSQETLEVNLEPSTAVSKSQIAVGDLSGVIARKSSITQLPVHFSLSPRTYSVRVAAADFESERRLYPVDLYEATTIKIKMEPVTMSEALPAAEQQSLLEKSLTPNDAPGTINIHTKDALVRVELLDNTRAVIASQEGSLSQSNLKPGFYRARMITPEGAESEQLVELGPEKELDVWLNASSPHKSKLFQSVLAKSGIDIAKDNTLTPSEAVGPLATAHVTTLLALAAGAASENSGPGYKLRQIGLNSFQQMAGGQASSGVQIVLAVEAGTSTDIHAYLTKTRLQCWSQSQAMPAESSQLIILQTPEGVAQFAWDLKPDSYWLSIQPPDQHPVTLALTVPENHLALIIFYKSASNDIRIHHYLTALVPDDPADQGSESVRFPTLRRSEMIQRSYLSGRLEEPQQNMTALLHAKWMEPVASCLAGYMLLKIDPNHSYWPKAIDTLSKHARKLSDSHVISAAYLAHQGKEAEARAAFLGALEHGLPVVSEGLVRLMQGIERHQIEHPHVNFVKQAYANRVPGLLWTAVPVTEDSAPVFDVSGVITRNQSGGVNLGAGSQAKAENIVGGNLEKRSAGRDYYEAHGNMIFQRGKSDSDDASADG